MRPREADAAFAAGWYQTPPISDSPIGTAAWIVEKLKIWSDSPDPLVPIFTKDQVLTNVTPQRLIDFRALTKLAPQFPEKLAHVRHHSLRLLPKREMAAGPSVPVEKMIMRSSI
jgi:hypothetical protein